MKDRSTFKQLSKSIDFQNDKQLNISMKISKKALLAQIPEQSKGYIQYFMQQLFTQMQPFTLDYNAFIQAQTASQAYIVPKDHPKPLLSNQN